MKNVIILSGPDGSGKSTLAKHLADKFSYLGEAIICSSDDFFIESGEHRFDSSFMPVARGQCFKKFMSAVADMGIYRGRKISSIIVDNPNLSLEDISPYIIGAQAFGLASQIIEIKCDTKLAAHRSLRGYSLNYIQAQNAKLSQRKIPSDWNYRCINAIKTKENVFSSRYSFIDNEVAKLFKAV